MEITKIDIKKELLNIEPRQILRIAKRSGISAMCLKEDEEPSDIAITFDEDTYELKEVRWGNGESKKYYVKIDDRKIFNELIEISSAHLETEFRKGKKMGTLIALTEYIDFLSLPWYKRLFCKKQIKRIKEEIAYNEYNK